MTTSAITNSPASAQRQVWAARQEENSYPHPKIMRKLKNTSQTCLSALLGSMILPVLLTGCGTPLSIRNIQKYNRVSVLDIANKSLSKTESGSQQLRDAGRHFADLLALELENSKAFEKVTRETAPQPGSLSVSGDITRCVEGSRSVRVFIGHGAGASSFDATIQFADADTGEKLGETMVDEVCLGVGGGTQSHMEDAAKEIAGKVAKAKASAGK
jgi:hypothetical protein